MARIVVCGYMVRHPLVGNVLAYFQYVLGLHRLGHQVLYLEESGWSDSCCAPVERDYGDGLRAGLCLCGPCSPPTVWTPRWSTWIATPAAWRVRSRMR
jgi:hypothetical protein